MNAATYPMPKISSCCWWGMRRPARPSQPRPRFSEKSKNANKINQRGKVFVFDFGATLALLFLKRMQRSNDDARHHHHTIHIHVITVERDLVVSPYIGKSSLVMLLLLLLLISYDMFRRRAPSRSAGKTGVVGVVVVQVRGEVAEAGRGRRGFVAGGAGGTQQLLQNRALSAAARTRPSPLHGDYPDGVSPGLLNGRGRGWGWGIAVPVAFFLVGFGDRA